MGSFQAEPLRSPEQAVAFASATDGIPGWLDGLVARLASGQNTSDEVEETRSPLTEAPFAELLLAIERARPGLGVSVEIAIYQQWIAANGSASPLLYAAWFNVGVLFGQVGDNSNAATAYRNALALRSDLHGAAINLGLLLESAGHPEQALATWRRATQPEEVRIALEIQQGRLLEKLGRLEEAEKVLYRVLVTDPAQFDVVHHWIHIRQKMCCWPVAASNVPGIPAVDLVRNSGPLSILALTDDIELQCNAAAAWIARKTEPAPRRLAPEKPWPHERIRIGYMSSDFCNHAMAFLITELFERHDRQRFEVFGYCSSLDDGSELRKRVLAAFDHYRIIRTLSDEQAAQIIRDDEIDVLIELNGITEGSRLAVLRWRPAPVQATYLGFVGPVPLPELDYLLCDNMVIPPEHKASYQPVPLPIAQIYQANDSKRTTGRQMSRSEEGLPENQFVFCCFSKHYKITAEMFAAWMSILRQAEGSVLWLAKDNMYSQANLLAAAGHEGIAGERLIFSERTGPNLYLSRLGLADLFLDTFPYNAGTVASDAIRMQLPLVTLCGKAFASRMAASLLHAAGASHGITTSLSQYVRTAVQLATDPVSYSQYKDLFATQTWQRTIGDIAKFSAEFEDTWSRIIGVLRDK
jgi:predicted O-linked N-acetylglucosamine transferase (SPINDLY family)